MKKLLNLVGAIALVLLLAQSTIGIITYVSGGTPQGFPDRGSYNQGGNGVSGTSSQTTGEGTDSIHSSAQEDTLDQSTENGRMRMNMAPQDNSFTTTFRSFENGIPGLVLNCLSFGAGIAWILLFLVTRKKQQRVAA